MTQHQAPSPLQDAIRDWLDGLLAGRVRTSPLHSLPAFPAADGSDAAAAAEAAAEAVAAADEFDLSDIMQVGPALAPSLLFFLSSIAAATLRDMRRPEPAWGGQRNR